MALSSVLRMVLDFNIRILNPIDRGLLILVTPHAAVWLLGLCFAIDLLVQGLNYLNLAAVIHQIPSSSADS